MIRGNGPSAKQKPITPLFSVCWCGEGFEARVGLSKFANYFSGAGGAASLRDHHLVCPGGDSGISPIVPSLHNERAIYRL